MDKNLKRTIILDNYENPFNKGLTNDDSFDKVNANNESCIDEAVELAKEYSDDKVKNMINAVLDSVMKDK